MLGVTRKRSCTRSASRAALATDTGSKATRHAGCRGRGHDVRRLRRGRGCRRPRPARRRSRWTVSSTERVDDRHVGDRRDELAGDRRGRRCRCRSRARHAAYGRDVGTARGGHPQRLVAEGVLAHGRHQPHRSTEQAQAGGDVAADATGGDPGVAGVAGRGDERGGGAGDDVHVGAADDHHPALHAQILTEVPSIVVGHRRGRRSHRGGAGARASGSAAATGRTSPVRACGSRRSPAGVRHGSPRRGPGDDPPPPRRPRPQRLSRD